MKTRNRLFAILLALAMVVTYMPGLAYATEAQPADEPLVEESAGGAEENADAPQEEAGEVSGQEDTGEEAPKAAPEAEPEAEPQAEPEEEPAPEEEPQLVDSDVEDDKANTVKVYHGKVSGLDGSDALLEAFMQKQISGSSKKLRAKAAGNTRFNNLSEIEQTAYTALASQLTAATSGEEGPYSPKMSAKCVLTWEEAKNVVAALMADMPYEFFWYDKQAGYSFWSDPESGYATLLFSVAVKYRSADPVETLEFDDGEGGTETLDVYELVNVSEPAQAAAYARSIVDDCEADTDVGRLITYKDVICGLVTYNEKAAASGGNQSDLDPWEMIYVFDQDPDTNVVCEGYSKAFQYLCDYAQNTGAFDNSMVDCYSVTGTMSSSEDDPDDDPEGHMWNILRMDDGKFYIADITNSDAGSAGFNEDDRDGSRLFLNGYSGTTENDGYVYDCNNQSITYEYDNDTLGLYDNELVMSSTSYGLDEDDDDYDEPLAIELTADEEVLINDRIGFNVSTTGCDEIKIYKNYVEGQENEPDRTSWESNPSSEDEWLEYEKPGTYIFRVEAFRYSYDSETDEDVIDEQAFDQVEITATQLGKTGTFTITKAGGKTNFSDGVTVTRGENVTVECTEAACTTDQKASHYWIDANIFDSDAPSNRGEWYGHYGDSDSTSITFNTIEMEPGDYLITAGASGPGYASSASDNSFKLHVTDLEIPEGEMYLNVSDEELITGEEFEVTAYCPGAKEILVCMDYQNDGWEFYEERNAIHKTHSYDRAGTFEIHAIAYLQDERIVEAVKIINVEAPYGSFDFNLPDNLPSIINLSEMEGDLSFTVPKPDGAESMWIEARGDSGDLFDEETRDEPINVLIKRENLTPGSILRLWIGAVGDGYDLTELDLHIPVVAGFSDDVVISTDIADADNVYINQNIKVKATFADDQRQIEEIYLFDGESWHSDYSYENGAYTWDISYNEAGKYTIFADVLFKDSSEDEWTTSRPITIEVKSKGKVKPFSIRKVENSTILDQAFTVTRGESITIESDPAICEDGTPATVYWLDVLQSSEDDEYGWSGYDVHAHSDSNKIELNTIEFEPGLYRIRVGASGEGYEGAESDNYFDLKVENLVLPEGKMYFELSNNASDGTLTTCEDFTFNAYYPGAHRIVVYMDYNNNKDWYRDNWDEAYSDTQRYGHSGVYTLVAAAYNSAGEPLCISEPIEVNVEAPNGQLDWTLPEIPASISEGENLNFTLTMPAHGDFMRVAIRDENGELDYYERESESGDIQVIIPASKLSEGMVLRVELDAQGYGYDSAGGNFCIPVTGAGTDGIDVSLSKTNNVYVNENIDVTADLSQFDTGGRQIINVMFFDGWDFRWMDNVITDEGQSRVYRSSLGFGDAGNYVIYVKVEVETDDGYSQAFYSAPIELTVNSYGKTGSFRITEVNGVPDAGSVTVAQGNLVTLTHTEADNAENYWLEVERQDEFGNWDRYEHYDGGHGTTLSFGTSELEPGEYRIIAEAGGYGYENSEADNKILLTVTENTLPPDGMVFNVSKTELLTGEEFTYSAYCPNADSIEIFMDYDGNRGWSRSDLSGTDSYRYEGNYTLKAIAYSYNEETGRHEEIATAYHEMVVTAPNGKIDFEMPELPAYLEKGGSGLSFEFAKPEYADFIKAEVRVDGEEENLFWDETNRDSISVELSDSEIEEGTILVVSLEAFGLGYEGERKEVRIPVLGAGSEDIAFNVNPAEVWVNEEDVNVSIDVSKLNTESQYVEEVEYYDGWEYHSDFEDSDLDSGKYNAVIYFNEAGKYALYARARLHVDGAEESVWVTSAPKTVTVKSHGKTGDFEITEVNGKARDNLKALEVNRGDMINVKYSESEGADHYWIDLMKRTVDGDWDWVGHFADTDQLATTLGTGDLEPGDYELMVQANAPGYENTRADKSFYFTLNESSDPGTLVLNVSNNELLTNEEFTYSAYCAGADSITVYMDYDNNREWYNTDWSGTESYGNPGTYTLMAVASVYDEESGEWSEKTVYQTITVSAPNGSFTIVIPEELPNSITPATESIAFTAVKPDGARDMSVEVWAEDEYSDRTDLGVWGGSEDSQNVTVNTGGLSEGSVLYVKISAWGVGWEYTESTAAIPVISEPADSITLTADKSEVFCNDAVKFTLTSEDDNVDFSTAEFYNAGFPIDEDEAQQEDGVFNFRMSSPGRFSVYATVQIDGTAVTSNVVTITVNSKGKLQIENPDLPGVLCVNEDLDITFNRPENAHSYGIEAYILDEYGDPQLLYGGDEDDVDPSDIWAGIDDEDTITLPIPADVLSEGMTFYVKFKGWGIGYEFNEVVKEITVVNHHLIEVEAVEPTFTEEGSKAYWECEYCGAKFKDEYGEEPIADEEIVIPATAARIRAAAKEALNNYKNPADYREAQQEELVNAIEAGHAAIDAAADEEAVAEALANAKAVIDAIKTDAELDEEEAAEALANAKAAARTELQNYKDPADYREAQQAELATAIAAGNAAINDATDEDAVAEALANAKAVIDDIKTAAQMAEEEGEELTNAKTEAKAELDDYKNTSDYRPAQQTELAEAIAAGKIAIDNAADVEEVAAALANAKDAIDAIKTAAEMAAEEAEALAAAKTDAKAELDNYKDPADYRDAQKTELANAIAAGKTAIDNAADVDAVAEALADAKAVIDAIKTAAELDEEEAEALATAKTTAKSELENYADPADYRDAQKTELANAIAAGKTAIDNATNEAAVATALANAKTAIDAIKTAAELDDEEAAALANAKTTAKAELNDYADPADYRDAQKTELANAIAAGKTAIDNATNEAAVAAALANAKDAIDAIKTDAELDEEEAAEALAEAKTTAKAELDDYADPADYRDAQKTELANAIAAGKTAIDNATSEAAVAAAIANAKAAIDAIKTDAELDEEEAAQEAAVATAKKTAKAELDNYKSASDYRTAQQAELANAIAAGKAAIDKATSEAEVAAAIANAKAAIDKIKTNAQLTREEEDAKPKTKPEVIDLKAVKGLKLKGAKGKITVKWKKATKKELKTFQGYEIQYTLNGSFTDYPTVRVTKKKASVTLKKLLKKKKYTVKIRRYRDDGSVLHVSPWKTKRAKTK